jgi:hypothetical protein
VRRLFAVASALPADAPVILEARLHGGEGRVDLSVGVKTPAVAQALAPSFEPDVRGLLDRWTAGDDALAPVPCLWLELDLASEGEGWPRPMLCARLPHAVEVSWLLDALLPALHGRPLRPRQRQLALLVLTEIPASASPLYAFSLRARGGEAVRLEIFAPDAREFPDFLRRVAPELLPALETVLPHFDGVERLHLSLDLAETVLPRCGLEGSFLHSPQRERRWQVLFDRLVEADLCAPERRAAALGWPGHDTFWTAAERWPLREAGAGLVCVRGLSHVKVVCGPGQTPEAKVYLTLGSFDRAGAGGGASSRAWASTRST